MSDLLFRIELGCFLVGGFCDCSCDVISVEVLGGNSEGCVLLNYGRVCLLWGYFV